VLILTICTSCGTLFYPERRGQKSGSVDPTVAILDGIGLLFFIVPGLIAFAIDFSTGAIYKPGSGGLIDTSNNAPDPDAGESQVAHADTPAPATGEGEGGQEWLTRTQHGLEVAIETACRVAQMAGALATAPARSVRTEEESCRAQALSSSYLVDRP
jgi:hypothetical protein